MSGALINISTRRITWLAATNVTSEPLALATASTAAKPPSVVAR